MLSGLPVAEVVDLALVFRGHRLRIQSVSLAA